MKEKNIVDFTKMMKVHNEYYDENGDAVGCEICYTHQKAYEKLSGVNIETEIPKPVCPICGGPLSRRFNWTENGSDIVSEVNYSNPEGEIGFYSIWECGNCKDNYDNTQLYAMMPIPIAWNANHDIYYTGGKDYCVDSTIGELIDIIKAKVLPDILHYVRRLLNPEDKIDENLDETNLKRWCSNSIKHAVCTWMYNHGWKK